MPDKLTPEELAERHRQAVERDRLTCRSPLTPEEYAGADALGGYLRELRKAAGLSIDRASRLADLSIDGWARIERATRRTRHSTLERIAKGLCEASGADPDGLYAEMVRRADNALAAESLYRERIERRRAKRTRRQNRQRAQDEDWRLLKGEVEEFDRHLTELVETRGGSTQGGRIRF